jgi:hypothetical protein
MEGEKMKKLYPAANVSYDQTGINSVEFVGTWQGEEADELGNMLDIWEQTENADSLILFLSEANSCLEHECAVQFAQEREGLRGDWIRVKSGTGADYIIFKQLGMTLYSVYCVIA